METHYNLPQNLAFITPWNYYAPNNYFYNYFYNIE